MPDPTTGFTGLVDLAAERLGGSVLAANDEFFAPKESLVLAAAPVWKEGEYTERGKWMDGWETRRRRSPGHDWAIVRLGMPGVVRGVVVDTAFFTGNYPEHCSVDACALPGMPSVQELLACEWTEVLSRSPLRGDSANPFPIEHGERVTHLRLNIYPDGGVARLRVHGEVQPDWTRLRLRGEVDLAAMENGGFVVSCSDMFYGNRQNLVLPGRSTHMGDGWETRRRRGPGNDWSIVRLAVPGALHRIELDTDHFKGNAPGSCTIEGTAAPGASPEELAGTGREWIPILPDTPLQPHARHVWDDELAAHPQVTHVRLNIYPDGGVARLRLFGRPGGGEGR